MPVEAGRMAVDARALRPKLFPEVRLAVNTRIIASLLAGFARWVGTTMGPPWDHHGTTLAPFDAL